MGIYLERKVYGQLQEWKSKPNHSTLEVSGARQAGKTYIVNKFADEAYKNKVYVNLLDFSGEVFLELYHELRREMRDGKECDNPVHELMKRYRLELSGLPESFRNAGFWILRRKQGVTLWI